MNCGRELWLRYAPELWFDRNEPFAVKGIGCTVFEKAGKSPSFPGAVSRRRIVDPAAKHARFAIEYAYSYDYDIQHLYELEHAWVYVADDGSVCGCEGSFHGKYLNQMIPRFPVLDAGSTHVRLYVQPGKHAFLPNPELFALYPFCDTCCGEEAGSAGLDLPEMFSIPVPLTPELHDKVRSYIRAHYSFTPAWSFTPGRLPPELYTGWSELAGTVPGRIMQELQKAGAAAGGTI